MNHFFMEEIAQRLNKRSIGTIRFNFPHIDEGKKLPGSAKKSINRLVEVFNDVTSKYELPLFCGGKSYGGRMTSVAAADGLLEECEGIIYLGFPLHGPGKSSTERANHLKQIEKPMLFLQGMKDNLAKPDLLKQVLKQLDDVTACFYDDADHSFKVPKRSTTNQEDVYAKLTEDLVSWVNDQIL